MGGKSLQKRTVFSQSVSSRPTSITTTTLAVFYIHHQFSVPELVKAIRTFLFLSVGIIPLPPISQTFVEIVTPLPSNSERRDTLFLNIRQFYNNGQWSTCTRFRRLRRHILPRFTPNPPRYKSYPEQQAEEEASSEGSGKFSP